MSVPARIDAQQYIAELQAEVATLRRRIDFFDCPEKMCLMCWLEGPCDLSDQSDVPGSMCGYDLTYPELIAIAHAAEAEARELRKGTTVDEAEQFEQMTSEAIEAQRAPSVRLGTVMPEEELEGLRRDRERLAWLNGLDVFEMVRVYYDGPQNVKLSVNFGASVYGDTVAEAIDKAANAEKKQ